MIVGHSMMQIYVLAYKQIKIQVENIISMVIIHRRRIARVMTHNVSKCPLNQTENGNETNKLLIHLSF